MRFPSIKKDHAGVYKCVAEDRAGNRYTYDVPVKVVDRIGKCVYMCVCAVCACMSTHTVHPEVAS